jgi:hypothetical protein
MWKWGLSGMGGQGVQYWAGQIPQGLITTIYSPYTVLSIQPSSQPLLFTLGGSFPLPSVRPALSPGPEALHETVGSFRCPQGHLQWGPCPLYLSFLGGSDKSNVPMPAPHPLHCGAWVHSPHLDSDCTVDSQGGGWQAGRQAGEGPEAVSPLGFQWTLAIPGSV